MAKTKSKAASTEKVNGKGKVGKPAHGENDTSRFGQFVLICYMIYPWAYLLLFPLNNFGKNLRSTPYTSSALLQDLKSDFKLDRAITSFDYLQDPKFWLLVAQLSTPHVYYFLIWTQPRTFFNLASKLSFLGEPYQVLAKSAHVIKFLQLTAFLTYVVPGSTDLSQVTENFDKFVAFLLSQSVLKWIFFLQFGFLGQIFNAAVYQTLGEAGVYYGVRLGKTIPWVKGFPFNVVSHAQYLGAVMSIWAAIVMGATDSTVDRGCYGIAVVMTIYYIFSSYVEANL